MTIANRLEDLRIRDELASQSLGPSGEKLKSLIDKRSNAVARQLEQPINPGQPGATGLFDFFVWGDFQTGVIENENNIKLRWVGGEAASARLLEYIPHATAPFAFTDSTGHRIVPGRFWTDGGTIPAFATVVSGINRFSYLPAYLIHDWEYVLHHCDQLDPARDQKRVDAALLETLKTMMTTNLVDESRTDFWAIETALGNFASLYWSANSPCSL